MPTPAHSIITRVRRHFLDTLASISTVSGYHIDVDGAAGVEPEGTAVKRYRCTVNHRGTQITTEGHAQGKTERRWPWEIFVDIFQAESAVEGLLIGDTDELREMAACAIELALCVDRQRGGFAFDTVIIDWEPVTGEEGVTGITVTGYCDYRTQLGIPNEL